MDTLLLGYDPGGNGKHGVAALRASGEALISADVSTEETVENAAAWFAARMERADGLPVGLGVDTLTAWSTGRSGWRPADRKLRNAYPKMSNSVVSSNSLYGAMAVNGILMVLQLKSRDPDLLITETHPKALWHAMASDDYDFRAKSAAMNAALMAWLGVGGLAPRSDHEWDALISAYAVHQGRCGHWTTDLHALPAEVDESIIFPAGKTFFYWPMLPPDSVVPAT